MNQTENVKTNNTARNKWQKRNEDILEFLGGVSYKIRLVGNIKYPAIIVDERICMNGFIQKNTINFTDSVSKGKVIRRYDITTKSKMNSMEFESLILKGYCRKIYKIRHVDTDLYLHSCRSIKMNNNEILYPLFAKVNVKIYFNLHHANSVINDLKNYNLIVE